MQKLTLQGILGLQDVSTIGSADIVLLPWPSPVPNEETNALLDAGVIPPEKSVLVTSMRQAFALQLRYDEERSWMHKEPAWVDQLPMRVRVMLRYSYALIDEDIVFQMPAFWPAQKMDDPFRSQPTFSAGLSYQIKEGGLCHEVYERFNLWRLTGIRQLGYLNQPTYNSMYGVPGPLTEHTRWAHSLDVYCLATAIGHNAGLSKQELSTLGMLALTHDVRTPAGGDSVKLVDPAAFDEDETYGLTLREHRTDLAYFAKKYGVSALGLLRGVKNRGLLGELLDIADKLAYIARDIAKCLHHIEAGAQLGRQPGHITLLRLLDQNPFVCSVWDAVELDSERRPYFADSMRLLAFLKVRVLMFRELYYHPETRFGEFFMSRLFVKMLYDKGELTRKMLLEMNDSTLTHFLDTRLGAGLVLDNSTSDIARVSVHRTLEEARAFVVALKARGIRFVMIDDNRRAIKPGTHFRVKHKGKVMPLKDADPGSARELEEMATMLPLVHVYHLEGDPRLPKEVVDELAAYVETQAVG